MSPLVRRIALALGALLLIPVGGAGYVAGRVLAAPAVDLQPLPGDAISLDSDRGRDLLATALAADHAALWAAFQSQEKGSWCGVASAVTVLNARGASLTQDGFFTPEVTAIRPWWRTTFGGMPITHLGPMLAAHGAPAEVRHADEHGLDVFRADLAANLATAGDQVVVNYDRRVMGEAGAGHISPVSALSADGNWVLLLDTATYKYPAHWVPVDRLYAAMHTPDSESGRSRGWILVHPIE